MDVLIACRNHETANGFIDLLSDYFSVRHTDTEWDLKQELKNRHYDIVIFDYDLPQVSGIRYVESLRSEGLLPALFFVCGLEAISSYDSRLRALETSTTQVLPVRDMAVASGRILIEFVLKPAC
jgi:DNA-binding response OmpR family regulator